MMVTGVIMFLITTTAAKHHHSSKSILDQNENFFSKVFIAIHTVVDHIFQSIDLPTKFTDDLNTKFLLTMHKDLSKIADKTFEIFKDIEKIIKVNITHSFNYESKENAIKLDTIVNDVLNERNYNVYNVVKKTQYRPAKGKTKAIVNPDFDNSKEFTKFVITFLEKVNNLSNYKKPSKHVRHAVPSKRRIKAWVAPSNFEPNIMNTRRIFKGSKTKVNTYPFIASIHIMGEFTCSGCIIRRDVIISSASCLRIAYKSDYFQRNLKSIYVRLGSDHTTRGGETIPVQELHFHPEYEPTHLLNNLAIIRLEKRVRFARQLRRTRRILWDRTPGSVPNDTKSILIVGWGATKSKQDKQEHPKLKVGMLDIYDTNDCMQKYKKDFINQRNFCGAYNNTIGAACNGDSGGPGIVGAVLMGVVSFGAEECGAVGKPTVFTKLGYYAPWIESVLNLHKKRNETNDKRKMNDLNLFKAGLKSRGKEEKIKLHRDALIKLIKANKARGRQRQLQRSLRQVSKTANKKSNKTKVTNTQNVTNKKN